MAIFGISYKKYDSCIYILHFVYVCVRACMHAYVCVYVCMYMGGHACVWFLFTSEYYVNGQRYMPI
jgi:hypothetical protein